MCGVCGVWHFDGRPPDERRLIAARDVMISRGPDDAGIHIEPGVGLAHRRLSIIDLSPAGRMPMSNESGEIWGVFNGEIYNFPELRARLEALGHTFRSDTDSEVTIHAYEQWGTDCFRHFEGMFAIAIWDRAMQRLVLARDITGEKPLSYAWHAGRACVFASSLSALIASGEVAAELDPDAVRAYIQFGFVPAPASILRGVRKVEPGTFIVIDRGQAPRVSRYWDLAEVAARPKPSRKTEDCADELHALLRAAVRERLVSDVPLGAFLSGGIDSSLVVALMAELVPPSSVRTFTIGFRESAFDESSFAHRVAKHLGVENTMMVLSAGDVLRELPNIARAFDEPMADYSALPTLAVARLARRHVTVALTGDGADVLFGGYRYYSGTRAFERIASITPAFARRWLARGAHLVPNPRASRALRRASATDPAAFFGASGFYRGAVTSEVAARALHPHGGMAAAQLVSDFVRAQATLSPTEGGMLWDATHTLADAWLAKVDRTTMAASLEARAPFLNRKVIEYAFTLPIDQRVRLDERKVILRRILARYLPADLIDRPKQGFTAPMKAWFANELYDELTARLAPDRLARYGVLDERGIGVLFDEHRADRADHTQLLWALFHLDQWHEAILEGAPSA
jgi:asparagine synthase (glutamine-hydrolysing)